MSPATATAGDALPVRHVRQDCVISFSSHYANGNAQFGDYEAVCN